MPAFNPENLTHYNEDLYTFEAPTGHASSLCSATLTWEFGQVSWDPGDPKARACCDGPGVSRS